MDLREYLREEIVEESGYGYVSSEEGQRRLAVFDAPAPAPTKPGPDDLGGLPPLFARAGSFQGAVPEHDPSVYVDPADRSISAERRTAGSGDPITSYVAGPSDAREVPGVLVIHENRGLTPYIEDVARRLAKAGYVALAPDLLWREGGAESFDDAAGATAALGKLSREDMMADLQASLGDLASTDGVRADRLGVIGFCFGGGLTWALSTREQRLAAAVPFYGPNPPLEDVANISAPVLAIYGALDERINAGIPDIERTMAEQHKTFEKIIYPDAQHAFHNDTNPDRYNKQAAEQAWTAALAWFDRWLKG